MPSQNMFSGAQLRSLRKEAGYTQFELAQRIGLSRETVSAIENNKPKTMENIPISILNKWWSVCRQTASEQARECFFTNVIDYFGFNLNLK